MQNLINILSILISFVAACLTIFALQPIWNKYISKIKWAKKWQRTGEPASEENKEFSLVMAIAVSTLLVKELFVYWQVKIGFYLAFVLLLSTVISYQVIFNKFHNIFIILVYLFSIYLFLFDLIPKTLP